MSEAMVMIPAAALQLVLGMLDRDAEKGNFARKETAEILRNECKTPPPELDVFFESMPESNGKRNWTVMLHRKGETGFDLFEDGLTYERSEYYDRARYEADRLRYLLGQIDVRPEITDYDPNIFEKPV